MKRFLLILSLLIVSGISTVGAQNALTPAGVCENAGPAVDPETRDFAQAEEVLEADVDYYAVFCTAAGAVYIDLLEADAPITVNNFVFLAQQGYFNNTVFHRVIQGFMAQGGDPTATGTGDPGYRFEDEFVGSLHFDQPGWLAMANSGPATNGSQFFITTVPTPHLDYRHTIFGEVLQGQDNVEGINIYEPGAGGEPTALNTVVIITDPEAVSVNTEAVTPTTADETLAIFEGLADIIPPEPPIDVSASGLTTEEAIDLAPETVREEFAAYMSQYNHDYRVTGTVASPDCDFGTLPFVSFTYTLDAFASRADAAAALIDPALSNRMLADGFGEATTSENAGIQLYTQESNGCDTETVHGITAWQRGRYLITAEIVLPADSQDIPFIDLWLTQVVGGQIYGAVLADIIRPEIG